MQQLVASNKEPITPFVQKILPLYRDLGVSCILVMGISASVWCVCVCMRVFRVKTGGVGWLARKCSCVLVRVCVVLSFLKAAVVIISTLRMLLLSWTVTVYSKTLLTNRYNTKGLIVAILG